MNKSSVEHFRMTAFLFIYLLKANNRTNRTRREICSNLTIKITERRHWRHSGVFIVNVEYISHLVLMFLLLTLNMQLPAGFLSFTRKET